jgi:N utilization substance protein B
MGYGGEGVGSRREARERAMSLLYEAETKGCEPLGAVLEDLVVDPQPFAAEVVAGVSEHRGEIDVLITRFARGWSLDRMPALDRALLRMGVYELAHRPDVPVGAVITEAVELAKRFSTDDSGRFVNGVLGRISADLRQGPDRSEPSLSEVDAVP